MYLVDIVNCIRLFFSLCFKRLTAEYLYIKLNFSLLFKGC
jgi:hypothetical protein